MNRLAMLVAGFVLLANVCASNSVARAQDANVECALAPIELPLFDATPAAQIADAAATPASPDDPGRDASDDELAEFTEAIDVIVGCANSGDAALVNAVFTERYLASKFADPGTLYQPDFEQMIAENRGIDPAADPLVVDSIAEVTVLDDGRLRGEVMVSSSGESSTDILVLANVDGHWLIDDVIFVSR